MYQVNALYQCRMCHAPVEFDVGRLDEIPNGETIGYIDATGTIHLNVPRPEATYVHTDPKARLENCFWDIHEGNLKRPRTTSYLEIPREVMHQCTDNMFGSAVFRGFRFDQVDDVSEDDAINNAEVPHAD